jgi:multidrug efflux pump subunit AcrB
MIVGMMPLALVIGEGAKQRAPMAQAVIGGLITSPLLMLFRSRCSKRCWMISRCGSRGRRR